MKRFPNRWTARAAAVAIGLQALSAAAFGQDKPVISARPGQRPVRELPAATQGSVSLSLDQAIGLALSNNQDLNVTIDTAEASRFSLFQTLGIYDPLVTGAVTRAHSEQPASSTLSGAPVPTADVTDFSASVQQLAPTGGFFSLGFTGRNTRTNSSFASVNPSKTGSLTLSLSQPLLRNFGSKTTTWLIRIARSSQDSAYQDFVRSAQSVVNSVEQAYWDLVYALQNLEVKKESLRIAQDLNRITKIKIDVGSLAPIEITQTEVGIATAEQDIITAEGLIGDAQDRVQRVMNVDPTRWFASVIPTDQVRGEDVQIQLDEGTKTALARRPEVLQAAYLVDRDRIRYDYYANQVLPNLNLVGSYGTAGLAGDFFRFETVKDQNGNPITVRVFDQSKPFEDAYRDVLHNRNKNWSVGLNFSFPILNRAARGAYGAARYQWESDKARLTTTEQNVVVEVRAAARAIDTARRSIAAAGKGRELAEKNLDAGKKKFDNGMATSFEVTQIQRDLSVARTAELQALAVYRKALAAYHFATADILDWKGVQIEGLPETTPPPLSGITAERR